MRFTVASTLFLSLVTVINADYAGFLYKVDEGDCPKMIQSEDIYNFSWSSEICEPVGGFCPDGKCGLAISANWIGGSQVTPEKFKMCGDNKCDNCDELDIDQQGTAFRLDCADFSGQSWMYIG